MRWQVAEKRGEGEGRRKEGEKERKGEGGRTKIEGKEGIERNPRRGEMEVTWP